MANIGVEKYYFKLLIKRRIFENLIMFKSRLLFIKKNTLRKFHKRYYKLVKDVCNFKNQETIIIKNM